jgi:hypothetical protein
MDVDVIGRVMDVNSAKEETLSTAFIFSKLNM